MRRAGYLCVSVAAWSLLIGGYRAHGQPSAAVIPATTPSTSGQLTREQMEHFLQTARIVNERPIEAGITRTKRITLTDGQYTHDAHVQTIDVYKPVFRSTEGKIERNFRDSYKFNIAAYQLSKLLGMDMVPVCVYRVVDDKPSAVDWWVDDVMFDEEGRRKHEVEPPDLNYWSRQLNEMRDFDQLIANEDRNQGNLLVDKNWKVWAIDHSRSFRGTPVPLDPKVIKRITTKMLDAIKALDQRTLEANLLPWVTKEDIQALLARRNWMVKYFESEMSHKGADAIMLDLPRATPKVTIP